MNLNLPKLQAAISAGNTVELRQLLDAEPGLAAATSEQGVSMILWALYRGMRDAATAIAEHKPELDLFEAAALGLTEKVSNLLRDDPTAVSALAADGFPALGLAVFFGQSACAALLLAAGADAGQAAANPMRVAPIHAACTHRDEELACRLAHLLLAFGADPNAPQQAGYTPLHSAAHRNQARLIRLLRAAGADPLIANDAGDTALDLARKEQSAEALTALQ
ncbi:MAG: ankyrin repeat domain-containing protein [Lysobacterales bacterium]